VSEIANEIVSEHDAIAQQLEEGVLTPLSAVAARLDSVMALTQDAQVQRRVGEAAAELERIAATLRGQLRELQRGASTGVRSRLRELVLDAGQRLGCSPRFEAGDELDELPEPLAEDLAAVLEEALANVVRHAYAGTLAVSVTSDGGALTLVVADDGVGPNDEPTSGRGLADMQARAEARGGSSVIAPNDPLGARVTWSVPL
jgi:signal transduction histidine kinase